MRFRTIILVITIYLSVFNAYSQQFPMEKYQSAVEARDFATITQIVKEYGTNTEDLHSGKPILLSAIEQDDYELAEVLLKAGVSTIIYEGLWDLSYLSDLIRDNKIAFIELLLDYVDIAPNDVRKVISEGRGNILELFIRKGFDIHSSYSYNAPAGFGIWTSSYFALAIYEKQYDIARDILEYGIDINGLSKSSGPAPPNAWTCQTALDIAISQGETNIQEWIRSTGGRIFADLINDKSIIDIEDQFFSYSLERGLATVDDLRLRSKPGLHGDTIGGLTTRDSLVGYFISREKERIDGFDDYWYYVITETGKRGWAYGGYLEWYSIGDIGPAGGIIFYNDTAYGKVDIPNAIFLEAAPESTEWVNIQWGASGAEIRGADRTAIGTGKQNTADLIAHQRPGSEYAAQLCDGLIYGGYDDWFLPSKDELNLMSENLHKRGLGGFADSQYWSSSEGDSNNAWELSFFGSGYEGKAAKGIYPGFSVRAIRAF